MPSINIQLSTIEEADKLYLSAMVEVNEIIHLPTEQERAALPIWKRLQSETAQAMKELQANQEYLEEA